MLLIKVYLFFICNSQLRTVCNCITDCNLLVPPICYFIKNVVVSLERHHHFITPDQTFIRDGGTLKKHVLLNNLKIL